MILKELLIKQIIFNNIDIKYDNKELPKELKVKVMKIRTCYNKIKSNFESEVKSFMSGLITQEFKTLYSKDDKTEEEQILLHNLKMMIANNYKEFIKQKELEFIDDFDDYFTLDEYADILEVNAGKDVIINGKIMSSIDFMSIIYELFVKDSKK